LESAKKEHTNIKFTLEVDEDSSLPFLDKLVIRDKERISFKLYRKPTSSDRYIDAFSHHHPAQLNGVMKIFFPRVLSSTDEKYRQEDTDTLKNIFMKNNFKIDTINKCLKKSITQKHTKKKLNSE
jgi:hypothetical protein